MYLKMSSAKWRPCSLGLNVLAPEPMLTLEQYRLFVNRILKESYMCILYCSGYIVYTIPEIIYCHNNYYSINTISLCYSTPYDNHLYHGNTIHHMSPSLIPKHHIPSSRLNGLIKAHKAPYGRAGSIIQGLWVLYATGGLLLKSG